MQWATAAVVLFAALLRLRGISGFILEQDELYTVLEGTHLFDVELQPGIDARPLYFLLQHVLLKVLPVTEVGLRIVPWIFGVLGVWATCRLAGRVFGGYAGPVAGFFVAVAPWHLHSSTYARYWSLLFLLAALFFQFVWDAYQQQRRRTFILAALTLIAGTATHPSFLFPAFGASLGLSLVREDGRFGIRWPSMRAWTLLWGPYLLFIAAAFLALRLSDRGDALQNWSGRGWLASMRLLPAIVEWLSPLITVAGAVGTLVALSTRDPAKRSWGALAATGFLVALVLLLYESMRTDIYADYAVPALPLVFAGAGGLIAWLVGPAASNRRLRVVILSGLMAAATASATASHLSDGTRFDYRPSYAHILKTAPDVTALTWPIVVARHYAPTLHFRRLIMRPAELTSILQQERDLWVIASIKRYGMVLDDDGRVTAWLRQHCHVALATERPRWDYRVYRVNLYRCTVPVDGPLPVQ